MRYGFSYLEDEGGKKRSVLCSELLAHEAVKIEAAFANNTPLPEK